MVFAWGGFFFFLSFFLIFLRGVSLWGMRMGNADGNGEFGGESIFLDGWMGGWVAEVLMLVLMMMLMLMLMGIEWNEMDE